MDIMIDEFYHAHHDPTALLQGFATFNDDIQATAAVMLGALLGAQRQAGVPRLQDQAFLFYGAGQANIGAAQLLTLALRQGGLSQDEARSRIWLMDSQVTPGQPVTTGHPPARDRDDQNIQGHGW